MKRKVPPEILGVISGLSFIIAMILFLGPLYWLGPEHYIPDPFPPPLRKWFPNSSEAWSFFIAGVFFYGVFTISFIYFVKQIKIRRLQEREDKNNSQKQITVESSVDTSQRVCACCGKPISLGEGWTEKENGIYHWKCWRERQEDSS